MGRKRPREPAILKVVTQGKLDCLVPTREHLQSNSRLICVNEEQRCLELFNLADGTEMPPFPLCVLTEEQTSWYERNSIGDKLPAEQWDDYYYCEFCHAFFDGSCSAHPLLLIRDVKPEEGALNPSRASLPKFLKISTSSIPSAGKGVFTKVDLPTGILFGPYGGVHTESRARADAAGYSWKVRARGDSFYVDGKDKMHANWMRYINCCRVEIEQNLMAFQYHEHIYYRVVKPISADEELLVWYGDDYGSNYTVPFLSRSKKLSRIKTV